MKQYKIGDKVMGIGRVGGLDVVGGTIVNINIIHGIRHVSPGDDIYIIDGAKYDSEGCIDGRNALPFNEKILKVAVKDKQIIRQIEQEIIMLLSESD